MKNFLRIVLAVSPLFAALAYVQAADPVPTPSPGDPRDHVYVLLIDGFDPVNFGQFSSLQWQVNRWGFKNASYYRWFESSDTVGRIRSIRSSDPNSKIVLVGYSLGSIEARNVTDTVRSEGLKIDVLVYLGGDLLKNSPSDRPGNALKIVNVRGWGYLPLAGGTIQGADMDGAENYHLGSISHANLPTNPDWQGILLRKLTEVSAVPTVPAPTPVIIQSVPVKLSSPAAP